MGYRCQLANKQTLLGNIPNFMSNLLQNKIFKNADTFLQFAKQQSKTMCMQVDRRPLLSPSCRRHSKKR